MRAYVIALAAVCAAVAVSVVIFPKKSQPAIQVAQPALNRIEKPAVMQAADSTAAQSLPVAADKAIIQKKKPVHFSAGRLAYIKPSAKQIAVITGTTDTSIRFSQGTALTINPADFVNETTGQPVAGPVKLQVTEHYRMEDILLNDLSTATTNGMLETNGMINIQAFTTEGQSCKLKKGGLVGIRFPIKNNKPGMQLFSASKDSLGNIFWIPMVVKENKTAPAVVKLDTNEKAALTVNTQPSKESVVDTTINSLPQFPGGIRGMEKDINTAKNKFPVFQENAVVIADFNVSPSGRICWVRVLRSTNDYYAGALQEALYKMPAWKPAIEKGKPRVMTMRLAVSFTINNPKLMRFWSCIKSPVQNSERMLDYGYPSNGSWGSYSNAQPNDVTLNTYVMTASSLGWINCDRFYNTPQPKIEMYVQEPVDNNTSMKMVFHSIRSVLNAGIGTDGNFSFANVPVGEVVTIIALKGEKKHLQMALKTVTVTDKPVGRLSYINVTEEEVRKAMEQFNKLLGAVAKNG